MAGKLLKSLKLTFSLHRLHINSQITCYHQSNNNRWRPKDRWKNNNNHRQSFDAEESDVNTNEKFDPIDPNSYSNRNEHFREETNVRWRHKPRKSYMLEEPEETHEHRYHGFQDDEEFEEFQEDDEGFNTSYMFEKNQETHQDFLRERMRMRKMRSIQIIRRKYFSDPPEVCLLSWAAKEQIRHLHRNNPEEWTPEQLAKSFPVSVKGVRKFLNSRNMLKTEHVIRKHDAQVAANWKALKLEGGPIVAPKKKHVSSTDLQPPLDDNSTALVKRTEFLDIVTSYQKGGKKDTIGGSVARKRDMSNIFPMTVKPMAAQEFRQRAVANIETNQSLGDEEKRTLSSQLSQKTSSANKIHPANNKADQQDRYLTPKERAIEDGFWHQACNEENPVPLKIKVNPQAKKKLHRYKDSYYDENGEFLYRVPGMNN